MKDTQTLERSTSTSPICIHHVAINVKDLQRSIDFFKDLVGLHVIDRDDHSAKLSIGDSEIVLFQLPSDINIPPGNKEEHPASLNHIALEIHPALFEKYHRCLKDNGVTITFGPVKRRHGYALYFLDPDGNKIELFYSNVSRNGN